MRGIRHPEKRQVNIEQRIILGGTVVHAADDGQLAAQGG